MGRFWTTVTAVFALVTLTTTTAFAQEPPAAPGTVRIVHGPRASGARDAAQLREFDLVGRFRLKVPAGTRWQIERPLQENILFLVLSPPPPDLARQLTPFRNLAQISVRLDRATSNVAVVRIADAGHPGVPLFVHVGGGTGAATANSLLVGTSQLGTVDQTGDLVVHAGRLKRYGPWQEFCRMVRTPLNLKLDDSDPESMMFARAEALFSHGEDRGAREIYASIAGDLTVTQPGFPPPKTNDTADYRPKDLASLRLADVSVCLGNVRAARLRYEVIYQASDRRMAEILAGLRWVQLAYPEGGFEHAEAIARSVNRPERSPLVNRAILHAARVYLLLGLEQDAMNSVQSLDGQELPEAFQLISTTIKQRALSAMVTRALADQNDVALVLAVGANEAVFWTHPRARTIAIETAEAFRRLLLPTEAVEMIHTALVKIKERGQDPLLMGVLARAYRERGDTYRASRTLDFLVESMESEQTWLGRREEASACLAAAETALAQEQWPVALKWLSRASVFGGGAAVQSLERLAAGHVAASEGKHDDATMQFEEAFARRGFLSPARRDGVVLTIAQHAFDHGKYDVAARTLRILMEETNDDDVEREATLRLAEAFAGGGDNVRAHALIEELTSAMPGDLYGIRAMELADRIDFDAAHATWLRDNRF